MLRFCSLQPILSFCKDDSIEIKIPIISLEGEINPITFIWSDLKIYEIPKNNFLEYERNAAKSPNIPFDTMRYCEIEQIVCTWKNEKNLTRKNLLNEFRNLFENIFLIEIILYDITKFYIFKIKAKANKIGILQKNKYIKFDLEVVDENEGINNQIQHLGLLNFSDRVFQVRKNTNIYFFISELNAYGC